MYIIQITKIEPRTEEERIKIAEAHKYGRDFPINDPYPNPDYHDRGDNKVTRVLNVEINDVEFQAVKKAVIEVM